MTINPLIVFVGLAVAAVGGLIFVSQQNKKAPNNPPKAEVSEGVKKEPASKLATLEPAAKAPPSPLNMPDVKSTPSLQNPVAKTPTAITPTFDIVKVEEDGGAVVVGKAAPNANVVLKMNGKIVGRAQANNLGDWIFVPDQLVPKGSHELIVEATGKDQKVTRSKQSIIISMPESANKKPLIVVSKAGVPSKVLQKPEKPVEKTVAKIVEKIAEKTVKKAPEKTVKVAVVPKPAKKLVVETLKKDPAKKIKLAFGTIDYNDRGDIVFSGTAQAGKTVRLYVDNKHVGDAIASSENTWVFRGQENIKPGTHELRADQVDARGQVGARTAVPFVRANPVKVAALLKTRKEKPEPKPVTAPEKVKAEVKTAPDAALEKVVEPQKTTSQTAVLQPLPAPTAGKSELTKKSPVTEVVVNPPTQTQKTQSEPETKKPELVSHVVIQPGNNLWNISRVIYGEGVAYTTIFEANKEQIKNPHRIYPGQIFLTPGVTSSGSIAPDQLEPLKQPEKEVPQKATVEN